MNDLTLICETCRQPIAGDTGSLYVRLAEIAAAREAETEWAGAHPDGTAFNVAELLTRPDDVRWRSAHDACRSDHDEGCYEIDAPLFRRWPHVARWTAHLMAKNWLSLTDWDSLLRELSGEARAVRIRVAVREAA